MRNIVEINQRLLTKLRSNEFAGYDVYDGLNSRLLKSLGLYRFPLVRLAWIQFFKRSPVNLRIFARIPKKRNPKGVALVILGLLEDYKRTGEKSFLEEAAQLGDWLLENRCHPGQQAYSCWGYHFPWEARAFHVPVGKPNIITTCYVARALWGLDRQGAGSGRFNEAACTAGRFIAESLYTEHDGRHFFAYIPGETAFVHNASLWGAAVVAETARILDDEKMKSMARTVCMQSVREQMSNGGWTYGSKSHHGFVDGFHTGYNLEALDMASQALKTKDFDDSIEKGLAYYRKTFFHDNGMPKYYNHATYPVDMHLVSQAVLTCLKVGRSEEDSALVERVLKWALEHMYIERTGYFRYQITRLYKNNICYLRWTQAWAYYALAFYLNERDAGEDHATN